MRELRALFLVCTSKPSLIRTADLNTDLNILLIRTGSGSKPFGLVREFWRWLCNAMFKPEDWKGAFLLIFPWKSDVNKLDSTILGVPLQEMLPLKHNVAHGTLVSTTWKSDAGH